MYIKYYLLPSLQRISLVTLSIWLWNQENIRNLILQFDLSRNQKEKEENWQEIENEVLKAAQLLPLPDTLRNQLVGFIKPVGLELLNWLVFHPEHLNFRGLTVKAWLPKKFCWSAQGTIDRRKTAEVMVNDQHIDVCIRFNFACVYCLEDDIKILWEKLSSSDRAYLKNFSNYKPPLVFYWVCIINNEVIREDLFRQDSQHPSSDFSFNAKAFRFCSLNDFEAASRYFLSKLTDEEKHKIIVETAVDVADGLDLSLLLPGDSNSIHCSEILYYLLLSMTEEEQEAVFKESSPSVVLTCFLYWPFQDLFLELVEKARVLFDEEDYFSLLHEILLKLRKGYNDVNYQQRFSMLWQQVPENYKKHTISKGLLVDSVEIGDDKNFKLILTTLTPSERQNLILFRYGHIICGLLIRLNKWDLLEFFICECATSKDSVVRFRRQYKEYRKANCLADPEQRNMETKLLRLLDDIDQKWTLDQESSKTDKDEAV